MKFGSGGFVKRLCSISCGNCILKHMYSGYIGSPLCSLRQQANRFIFKIVQSQDNWSSVIAETRPSHPQPASTRVRTCANWFQSKSNLLILAFFWTTASLEGLISFHVLMIYVWYVLAASPQLGPNPLCQSQPRNGAATSSHQQDAWWWSDVMLMISCYLCCHFFPKMYQVAETDVLTKTISNPIFFERPCLNIDNNRNRQKYLSVRRSRN